MRRLNGLGLGPITTEAPTTPTTGGTTKPSISDSIAKWLGIGQQAVDIYNSTKVGTGSNPNTMNYTPPPTPPADNTMKYVKIGAGVAGATLLTVGLVKIFSK